MVAHSLKLAPSFQVINTKQFPQKILFLNTEPLWGNIYEFELRNVQGNNISQRWIQISLYYVKRLRLENIRKSEGIGLKPDPCFRGVVL